MTIQNPIALENTSEIEMMCSRDNPVYEQIGCFSVALYALGYLDAPDFMDVEDLDETDASKILEENFEEIEKADIPLNYSIMTSKERYLLVIGNPLFPNHFAAIIDMKNNRPYFSKLNFMGSGYDSFEELINAYQRNYETDPGSNDISYFKER
ncbi:MAG: hypothetical protein GY699_11520 [Desulfobacteraceae bacterium]|nr:hypothetical protein [Desulfobacteraceae bacterium]